MRSGPGAARTILLFHIISARPSKQPRMVRTFLKVYMELGSLKVYMELGSYFLFLQEQIKDIIIIITSSPLPQGLAGPSDFFWGLQVHCLSRLFALKCVLSLVHCT